MGKKMKKFPFLFKATETTTGATTSAAAWPWPTCVNNPKTLSFRANATAGNIYKTMNSAYLDDEHKNTTTATDSSFSDHHHHHHNSSFSYPSEINGYDDSVVIGGLRSDRLFFEPGETSSILEVAKTYDFPYKESVAIMAMDSTDPFVDFRVSMEEMVEAHGLKGWDCLEELLTCYLRVNQKVNHGYVVGAFIDLLTNLALDSNNESSSSAIDEVPCSSSSTATQDSFTSPLSFCSSTYSSTSPCLSLLENDDEIVVVEKM